MTTWDWLIWGYLGLAAVTLLPTVMAITAPVRLHPGGATFDRSTFSAETQERLSLHYSRLQGTLGFWKREAVRSARFHYYCVWWTIISSSLMPFLTQAIDGSNPASKWFLTTVAAHVALVLGFHRGLKVAERFRAFRHGESEFYDMYRRLLDRPHTFGATEEAQVESYFEETERLRRFVRNAETDSLPTVDDATSNKPLANKAQQPTSAPSGARG